MSETPTKRVVRGKEEDGDPKEVDWSALDSISHPASKLLPPLAFTEIAELAHSIKAQGLLEAIKLHDGAILDGRHRYIGCEIAGVEKRFEHLRSKSTRMRTC